MLDVLRDTAATDAILARRRLIHLAPVLHPTYRANWHHELLADALDRVRKTVAWKQGKGPRPARPCQRLAISMPPQHGKLLAHSTPVLAVDGWKKHGDLRPGDRVFAPDGRPVRVLAESVEDVATLRMTFTDGASIDCHPRHEWLVYDRSRGCWRVVEAGYLVGRRLWSGGRAVFQVGDPAPLEAPRVELPLDPYTLGAWLGDGTSTKPAITAGPGETAVIDAIPFPQASEHVHPSTGCVTRYFRGLWDLLVAAGVAERGHGRKPSLKHVPTLYLTASLEQRLELLAGLVDTDGSWSSSGRQYVYSGINRRLVEDVADVARSCGFRVGALQCVAPVTSSSGVIGRRPVWRICWTPRHGDPRIPCRIERKRTDHGGTRRRRGIRSIEACPVVPGKCIQVEGGLYLVGRELVPTHNSALISQLWPAHLLGCDPSLKIVAASYSSDLAKGHAEVLRRYVRSPEYFDLFPKTRLVDATGKKGRDQATHFDLPGTGGYYRCGGIMGGITGWGLDIGILDDPIKNQEEADSEAYKKKLRGEWHGSFESRERGEHAGIVVVATRWAYDDLIGYLLELAQETGDEWEVIKLPAILDVEPCDGDPRKSGEALWASRFPISYLEAKRSKTPPAQWEALYQQRPSPEEGGMFRTHWWRYYEPEDLPEIWDERFFTVDANFKKTGRSWCVIQVWGWRSPNLYLLEQWREHADYAELKDAFRELARRYPDVWTKLIEDAANGPALISDLGDELGGMTPVPASESKVSRASFGLPVVRSGNVRLPAREHWTKAYVEEHRVFPHGAHDDQVDATAHAIRYVRGEGDWLEALAQA